MKIGKQILNQKIKDIPKGNINFDKIYKAMTEEQDLNLVWKCKLCGICGGGNVKEHLNKHKGGF